MSFRIFITGGAGFIGSHVVDECLSRGHTVCVYDNFAVGKREHLPEDNENLYVIKGDILDGTTLQSALVDFQPTHVLHLAALHFIPYCNAHPLETVDVNIKGTEQLFAVLNTRELPTLSRVLFASSAAVYAPSEDLHKEDEGEGPTDIYGTSKYANEFQGQVFHRRTGIDTVAARIFNAYGNRETNPHLVPEIIGQLKAGNTSLKLGNVTTKRSYIFTKDLARGLCDMIETNKFSEYTTCNIGSHDEYSAEEIVNLLREITGKDITYTSVANRKRKSDRPHLQPNLERIESLGWTEDYNIKKGLSEIVSEEL